MANYHRLTQKERYQIEALLNSGQQIRSIARQLGRSASTISREVRKAGSNYRALIAEQQTQALRRTPHPQRQKIRGVIKRYVNHKIRLDWSPEQIAGKLRKEQKMGLSHQTIYRYLARDKANEGNLYKRLRISGKRRRPSSTRYIPVHLGKRTMIGKRPSIVEKRKRLGDYERDSMMGTWNGPFLLTMVDRTSRYAKLAWVKRKCSVLVHRATVKHLQKETVQTITNDNGTEFAKHQETTKALGAKVYFTRAYRSWERGTNENFNGLLRQYYPRRMDLSKVTETELKKVEDLLNHRPRKCLGYQTPFEVHRNLKRQMLR